MITVVVPLQKGGAKAVILSSSPPPTQQAAMPDKKETFLRGQLELLNCSSLHVIQMFPLLSLSRQSELNETTVLETFGHQEQEETSRRWTVKRRQWKQPPLLRETNKIGEIPKNRLEPLPTMNLYI